MKKILIIKTSSMGDVIHTLPAVTDAVRAMPDLRFDWVVEEGFKEVPAWHPAVDKVMPVALRRWRKNIIKTYRNGEWHDFREQLRAQEYDLVIDAQGLLKSAFITYNARGHKCGLDKNSANEPLACLAYQDQYSINTDQHAVLRVRQLFSQAINYKFDANKIDYGIDTAALPASTYTPGYILFLHGTTWASKHWPEKYWYELAEIINQNNLNILIPWGTPEELERAKRIATLAPQAQVLPKMNLSEIAALLVNADGCVAVDTGLGHLAAGLNVPTVSVYGPTNPELTGTFGNAQVHLAADFKCAPCLNEKCSYKQESIVKPACFSQVTPTQVWQTLREMIKSTDNVVSTRDRRLG